MILTVYAVHLYGKLMVALTPALNLGHVQYAEDGLAASEIKNILLLKSGHLYLHRQLSIIIMSVINLINHFFFPMLLFTLVCCTIKLLY